MCTAVICKTCGKTTGAGRGQHVNQVLAAVPATQRCPGHPRAEHRLSGWLQAVFKRD